MVSLIDYLDSTLTVGNTFIERIRCRISRILSSYSVELAGSLRWSGSSVGMGAGSRSREGSLRLLMDFVLADSNTLFLL